MHLRVLILEPNDVGAACAAHLGAGCPADQVLPIFHITFALSTVQKNGQLIKFDDELESALIVQAGMNLHVNFTSEFGS